MRMNLYEFKNENTTWSDGKCETHYNRLVKLLSGYCGWWHKFTGDDWKEQALEEIAKQKSEYSSYINKLQFFENILREIKD